MEKSWRDKGTTFYDYQVTATEEQAAYLDSMEQNRLTISDSVSGSGKTTLAVAFAHYHQMNLLYLFSPVQENAMGFRPGGQQEKDSAYYGPLKDALIDIGQDPSKVIKVTDAEDFSLQWKSMASKEKKDTTWVEAESHTFLRGTNIGKAGNLVVVIDEAQNWTRLELRKTMTRCHDAAKVIVIGHRGQIDLPEPEHSGFERVMEVFRHKAYAKICPLSINFRGELSQDAEAI